MPANPWSTDHPLGALTPASPSAQDRHILSGSPHPPISDTYALSEMCRRAAHIAGYALLVHAFNGLLPQRSRIDVFFVVRSIRLLPYL